MEAIAVVSAGRWHPAVCGGVRRKRQDSARDLRRPALFGIDGMGASQALSSDGARPCLANRLVRCSPLATHAGLAGSAQERCSCFASVALAWRGCHERAIV